MVVTDQGSPRQLKVDRPREMERPDDGRTAVARHFEDGSSRTTIYDQHGGVKIITRRRNPSTGAEETTTDNPDGSSERVVETPDSTTTITTSPTGAVEKLEVFRDELGRPASRLTFPDGGVQTDVTIQKDNGFTAIRQNPDGSFMNTEYTETRQQDGSLLISSVSTETTGKTSTVVTVKRPDGSSEVTELHDGKPFRITNTLLLPDGATRERVHNFEKNTIETAITREYTKPDGAHVKEVLGEDRVQINTTRPDGSHSEVTKFDDGTQESTDSITRPDLTVVFTRTNRDGSFETTEHLPVQQGDPVRTITTSPDGTRTEQVLDDERMTTTVVHPNGTRTVIRRDMDGEGSTAEFDAQGVMTTVTAHEGEPPLETRSTIDTSADQPTPAPADGETASGDGRDPADEPLVEQQTGTGALPDVLTSDERPDGSGAAEAPAAAVDVDPVTGERIDVAGRGIALEPEVAASIEAEQAARAEQAAPAMAQPGSEPEPFSPPEAETASTIVEPELIAQPDMVGEADTFAEPETMVEPEGEPEPDLSATDL